MIKRILIIGFGMMGKSHLYSFINSKHKYQISIYDKKNYSKIEISNYFNKVNFLKKFPKKKKYDCVIIATSSDIRFLLLKKILKFNKVNKVILEKFIFPKIVQYKKFAKFSENYKDLILKVNTWGDYLYRNLKLPKNIKNNNVKIFVPEGTLLSNTIHYLDFCFRKIQKIEINLNLKRIINSKRNSYHEALGKISINTSQKQISIQTSKNKNDKMVFLKGYKLILRFSQFTVFKKKKIIQRINFPYAFKKTEKDYLSLGKKNGSNYDKISILSFEFLKKLKEFNKKKELKIT